MSAEVNPSSEDPHLETPGGAEDHLEETFGALTGESRVLPAAAPIVAPVPVEEPVLPAPTSRREARERAAALADRDQRRAVATAAIADAPAPEAEGKKSKKGPQGGSGAGSKPPRKRGRGLIGWLIAVIVIVALGVGVTLTWNSYVQPVIERIFPTPPADFEGNGSGQMTVSISSGDTGTAIARTLYRSGVTASTESFYKLLVSKSPEPVFQPGLYSLRKEMSAQAALDALQNSGNRLEGTVLLREGETGKAALHALADGTKRPLKDFEDAVKDLSVFTGIPSNAITLEGWLFPATYTFRPDQTPVQMIQTMIDRTHQALRESGMSEAQTSSPEAERIINIASIIQREARLPEDFPKVARVIQNRIAADMPLQMDSTAQYGKSEEDGSVWSSAAALNDKNGWNTYQKKGLPVTPIANPGDAAINAALFPAEGSWLFFVTVDLSTGETVFTNTLAEHDKAVAQLRSWCKANPDSGC